MHSEPHFQALIDQMQANKIETTEHLADYLKRELKAAESWLEANKKGGTATVKVIREKANHLDLLKKCHKLAQEFLF